MTQHGLPNLPLELLHEIINSIPDLPFPLTPRPFPASYPFLHAPIPSDEPRIQKTLTLRSLSQTCRLLRKFARPLAWEVIEVVSVRTEAMEEARRLRKWATKGQRRHLEYPEQLARDLRRQLRVVLDDEDLRENLRRVSVIITESSTQVALEMFNAFPKFPKLHTIQLLSLSGGDMRPWEEELFSALCNLATPLKSVKNAVLPKYANGLIRHCPALEVAVATLEPYLGSYVGKDMLKEIYNHCPSIKLLQGFPMEWTKDVEPLVKYCPQLVCLCIDDSFTNGYLASEEEHRLLRMRIFQGLSALSQLRHITLVVHASGPFEILPRHRACVMHCILLLGGISDVEEEQDEANVVNPFTSPFPAALLPIWFLKKIIPREAALGQTSDRRPLKQQDYGPTRTLTVDIAGIKRPVAIFSVAPPVEGDTWPRLLHMRVGYRSDDAFEELYDLIDIPLDLDQQPDPLSNRSLAKPQVFRYSSDFPRVFAGFPLTDEADYSSSQESDILSP